MNLYSKQKQTHRHRNKHYYIDLLQFTILESSQNSKNTFSNPLFLILRIKESNVSVAASAAAAKSLQSCPTLFNPIDGSPPGSPDPGILQARTLEWVAISFSKCVCNYPVYL